MAEKKWMCKECGAGPFKNQHGLSTHIARSSEHVEATLERASSEQRKFSAKITKNSEKAALRSVLTSDEQLALEALREFLDNREPQDATEELVAKSASPVLEKLLGK